MTVLDEATALMVRLIAERDEALAEVERLRDVLIDLRSDMRESAERDHPIPPPLAQTSAPGEDGMVTVRGDGIEGAQISAFNERTGEGVIGTADDAGRFELCLAAENGDSVLVWQRVVYERMCEELGSDTHRDPEPTKEPKREYIVHATVEKRVRLELLADDDQEALDDAAHAALYDDTLDVLDEQVTDTSIVWRGRDKGGEDV